MSADQVSRPKAVAMNVRERTRGWLNAVNLHWAGVAVLGAGCLYLMVQMAVAWQTAKSQNAAALSQQRIALRTAEIQAKPLEGLDVKLAQSGEQADKFYMERLPVSYSQIETELGVLKSKGSVRLARINFAQPVAGVGGGNAGRPSLLPAAGTDAAGGKLTEVQMDASLTGDYRSLVEFINGIERDKLFFVINGITLTGQQTGMVSLRLRMTTFLRGLSPADAAEKAAAEDESPIDGLDKSVAAQAAKSAGGAR